MNKQKKGFTLIELMVVIVIIGVLAAIAIPKLFGMTAKAKASEVGPAVGTWSKLQQAFLMEKESFGSWQAISYKAPGQVGVQGPSTTPNFQYNGNNAIGNATATLTNPNWTAISLTKLGDCTSTSEWRASFASVGAEVPVATVVGANCILLTPNFDKLK